MLREQQPSLVVLPDLSRLPAADRHTLLRALQRTVAPPPPPPASLLFGGALLPPPPPPPGAPGGGALVLQHSARTLAEVLDAVLQLGDAAGAPHAAGQLADRLRARLRRAAAGAAAALAACPGAQRPKVLVLDALLQRHAWPAFAPPPPPHAVLSSAASFAALPAAGERQPSVTLAMHVSASRASLVSAAATTTPQQQQQHGGGGGAAAAADKGPVHMWWAGRWLPEMLDLAGAAQPAGLPGWPAGLEPGEDGPRLSWDDLVRAAPDVLVIAHHDGATTAAVPAAAAGHSASAAAGLGGAGGGAAGGGGGGGMSAAASSASLLLHHASTAVMHAASAAGALGGGVGGGVQQQGAAAAAAAASLSPTVAALVAMASQPGWWSLPCVRSGLVFLVDSALVLRPGPRLVDLAEVLSGATQLHLRQLQQPAQGPGRMPAVAPASVLTGGAGGRRLLPGGAVLKLSLSGGQRCRPSLLPNYFEPWPAQA